MDTATLAVAVIGVILTIVGMGVMILIAIARSSRTLRDELGARIDAQGKRIDNLGAETNRRFDTLGAETNRRFDEVKRDNADLRERMAMLEGSLNGFLAGRRDRDAA